jgi:hypothetical protein
VAEEAQELTVTNSAQPLVVVIQTAETTEIAGQGRAQAPTNQTVTITTAAA